MSRITTRAFACLVLHMALVLGACGQSGGQVEETPAAPVAAKPNLVTPQPATPVVSTPVGTTPQPALPVVSTPEIAEVQPSPCPVPLEGAAADDCEALYQQVLARHGQDYSVCAPAAVAPAGSCPRPENVPGALDPDKQLNIQLILDSSGSMAADLGGQSKMEIAKDVLSGFVDTVPEEANVALRVYGHVGSNDEADRPESCARSDLLFPFQKQNAPQFKRAIDSFGPAGWTPIALALDQARADFAPYAAAANTNLIYLVSDGIETCDGDPVAAARALRESNVEAVVNIIGFDVDAEAAAQLRAAAQAGGGEYYEARSAEELQQVFEERVDFKAWAEYLNCANRAASDRITDVNRAQAEAVSCISRLASEEIGAINADLAALRDEYDQECVSAAISRATDRYSAIIASASKDYRAAVEEADQEYRDAIREADETYNDGTQQP
jgi:hypothetical protein